MAKKVLLVDDEESILLLNKTRLEAEGFEVEVAHDGPEGLSKARDVSPDIIVLDVMLPGINGYKVCQMLKFDESYQDIPIILLSARNQDSDIETGLQTGADVYIPKTNKDGSSFWETLLNEIKRLTG